MAVESFGSATTFQSQDTVKFRTQPAQTTNMEVSSKDQTVNVDATTASVTPVQTKNNENDSDTSKGNDAKENQQQTKNAQAASETLKKAIAEMNRKINNSNEEAIFGVHEDTNRIMIKIVDKETKEVIKEFPPEKTLDMIAKVWEMAGILVDERG